MWGICYDNVYKYINADSCINIISITCEIYLQLQYYEAGNSGEILNITIINALKYSYTVTVV